MLDQPLCREARANHMLQRGAPGIVYLLLVQLSEMVCFLIFKFREIKLSLGKNQSIIGLPCIFFTLHNCFYFEMYLLCLEPLKALSMKLFLKLGALENY